MLKVNDTVNLGKRNAEVSGEHLVGNAASVVQFAYARHFCAVKLGSPVLFAGNIRVSTFLAHITQVIGVCSKEQVGGIHA